LSFSILYVDNDPVFARKVNDCYPIVITPERP
jgi:hypothetical protein